MVCFFSAEPAARTPRCRNPRRPGHVAGVGRSRRELADGQGPAESGPAGSARSKATGEAGATRDRRAGPEAGGQGGGDGFGGGPSRGAAKAGRGAGAGGGGVENGVLQQKSIWIIINGARHQKICYEFSTRSAEYSNVGQIIDVR